MYTMVKTFSALDDWRLTVFRQMQPLYIEAPREDEFRAEVRLLQHAGIQLWDISSSSHSFERTKQQATGAGESRISLAMQLEGSGEASQRGNHSRLHPGEYTLLDWTQPYERSFEGGHRMAVVMLPRQLLGTPSTSKADFGAPMNAEDGVGPLVTGVISGLLASWPILSNPSSIDMVHTSFLLIRQTIAQHLDAGPVRPANAHDVLFLKIRSYILEHLEDPTLDPQQVADAHFISLRQLHKVFGTHGETVAAWMRQRRLERIREALSDPSLRYVRINAIAQQCGMLDASNMARAFRREYGLTPQQYRSSLRQD